MSMFCYQCQETAKGVGCTIAGVCGKKEDVANLQDLLIHVLKGISLFSTAARRANYSNAKLNRFVIESLFTTITNANFDKNVFYERIRKALKWRDQIKNICISAIQHWQTEYSALCFQQDWDKPTQFFEIYFPQQLQPCCN